MAGISATAPVSEREGKEPTTGLERQARADYADSLRRRGESTVAA